MAYLLIATSDGYVAPDGSVHPKGTAFNRVLWDGKSAVQWPPGLAPIADDGRAVWQPAIPKPTTISRLDFLARFGDTTLATLAQAIVGTPALFVWYAKLSDPVDLLDPLVQQGVGAMVAAGKLTQAQATAILTP